MVPQDRHFNRKNVSLVSRWDNLANQLQFNLCQFHNKRRTSFTLTFWDHCQQKTFCLLLSMAVSLSRGRKSSQYERQVNHSMFRKYFFPPWHTANDCIRQWSTVPGRRNSPIYVYKWDQTPQNYAHVATSKRRSRDVHETANEVSTDGSRRTQGLETRATTSPAELPTTPHCTTKVPPATALFGRNIRTKLPEKSSKVNMEEIDKKIN